MLSPVSGVLERVRAIKTQMTGMAKELGALEARAGRYRFAGWQSLFSQPVNNPISPVRPVDAPARPGPASGPGPAARPDPDPGPWTD